MALAAVQAAMHLEEKKTLHPFFSKPPRSNASDSEPIAVDPSSDETHCHPDYEQPESKTAAPKERKKRGRKSGASREKNESAQGKKQASLEDFTRRPHINGGEGAPIGQQNVLEASSLEEDPNLARRKRRKTASPGPSSHDVGVDNEKSTSPVNLHHQVAIEAGKGSAQAIEIAMDKGADLSITNATAQDLQSRTEGPHGPIAPPSRNLYKATTQGTLQVSSVSETKKTTPEKKLLKVNKNGKLLSPHVLFKTGSEAITPKKTRARKAARSKVSPTVTIIKYGTDALSRNAVGQKINSILDGNITAPRPKTSKKPPSKPEGPPKIPHPFFQGNTALRSEQVADKSAIGAPKSPSPRAQKMSAVTPGKLRAESRSHQPSDSVPSFGVMLGSSRASKQAGLNEPPWPSKQTAHVRNLDVNASPSSYLASKPAWLQRRKMKGNTRSIPVNEDLITILAQQLESFIHRWNETPVSDFEPPRDVRLPTRLLTTGSSVREEVRGQVRMAMPAVGEEADGTANPHPAVEMLFLDIEHTLTPFDLGKCENQSWAQKYAPRYASHVLQSGREAAVLRDWLSSLTVLAVSSKHEAKSKGVPEVKKIPKKKRKRIEDDFIVDSDDEEDEEMVEVPRTDEFQHDVENPANFRSMRRLRWTRNKNVVLVTGPSGCGKSAMVYAVANDLGFEVFEINPGSRRSGKDIQDKVGDMTENHLVNHKRRVVMSKPDAPPADDTDKERHDETLDNDLKSGRQGTMTSFFMSSHPATTKPKLKAQVQAQEPCKVSTSAQATLPLAPALRKSQKQSLILIEEADILFEEDQQFWAQIIKLASQSKRPIVITCNNETLIPTHSLPLAALLRLAPPPLELATDYMLALAGREGHVLERDAIASLYKYKDQDLRASITELDFWCQMSVGDKKGGLEWMYQRWPPGKDVDRHGRLLRIASKATYLRGMGCLSHNICQASDNIAFDKETELSKELWEDWAISPNDWHGYRRKQVDVDLNKATSLEALEDLDARSEFLSAADIYCQIDLPSYDHFHIEPADPSLPPMPQKERLSYTTSAPVIQVDHISDFNNLDTNIYTQNHILINRVYCGRQALDSEQKRDARTTENGFSQAILQHRQDNHNRRNLAREDFSEAFDLLAYLPDALPALHTSYQLTASSFDRTFRIIVKDVAPYVRSIVSHELVLEAQRVRLGNLLSEGGIAKRARTTRAARTALEGGVRETKRRERWFDKNLNLALVMRTAGMTWSGMGSGAEDPETEESERTGGSVASTQEE